MTFLVQRTGGSVRSLETFPLRARLGNAIVSYVRYLGMLVWPADLAVFYPHPGTSLSTATVFGAAILLVALSAAAIMFRRGAPFLFVGWFWFLITLVPVIGVVQAGDQALADRYTYVPFIGLFAAAAWGVPMLASRWRHGSVALRAGAAAALAALSLTAAAQARVWKNSETLFLHALKVTKNNYLADNNLGQCYNEAGKPAEGLRYLSEAVVVKPGKAEIHNNLGVSLFLLGRFDEAWAQFQKAIDLQPGNALALNNLGRTQFVQGEIQDAIRFYERSLAIVPDSTEMRRRLALALLMEGKNSAAVAQLQREVALDPSDADSREMLRNTRVFERNPDDPSLVGFRRMLADAHLNASGALWRREKRPEAAIQLRKALELDPASAEAHNELGTRLVGDRRLDEAAAEFELALRTNPGLAKAHNNLGYVLFLKGKAKEAIEQYQEALRLQPEFPLARNNLEQALRGQGKR